MCIKRVGGGQSVHVGDVVLFVPLQTQPVPRGKMRGYTVGVVVVKCTRDIVKVRDCTERDQVVYSRLVHVVRQG